MKANGFATVVMLMVLLSAGAVLSSRHSALNSLPAIDNRLSRLQSLVMAKRSLLHYTSTYSDLYGPTGSGPGHLPCPDTDAYRASRRSIPGNPGSHSPFAGDSPDPPCGNGPHAMGYLPRHVSLVDTRYAFHADATQHIWYRLATTHVNNPLSRVVNSQTAGAQRTIIELVSPPGMELQSWDELYESLASSDQQLTLNRRYDYVTLPVSEKEILGVTTRRVLRWFVDSYQRNRAISCENHGYCNAVPEARVRCEGMVLPETAMLLWLVPTTDASTCNVQLLEHVNVLRHWFIRNQWFEAISITIHNDCLAAHYVDCRLSRQDEHTLSLDPSS